MGGSNINGGGDRSMLGTPHGLDEVFTHTPPITLLFEGQIYDKLHTWPSLYKLVCRLLAERDRERFANLPDRPMAVGSGGIRYFGRSSAGMYALVEIMPGVYADTHLSANSICKLIGRLLDEFGIPKTALAIFLRE